VQNSVSHFPGKSFAGKCDAMLNVQLAEIAFSWWFMRSQPNRQLRFATAFPLIELLVVIAIIAILASML